MKIDVLTLFPEAFSYFDSSILKRAQKNGILEINVVDIRKFSKDKHSKCDDYPFGGGAGMLMTAQPIYDAVMSVKQENSVIVLPSPSGEKFGVGVAKNLSKESHLIFICGHYEGIDERIIEIFNPVKVSIGDYVLTGGELASMVMIDCISRFVEGVISSDSLQEESFSNGKLEYPQYTRPADFMGYKVPEVLLSGNHQEVDKWREKMSQEMTKKYRSDLIDDDKK